MVILARIVLVAMPLLAALLWLRYRMRLAKGDQARLERDLITMRRWLLGIVSAMFVAVLVLYFDPDSKGDPRDQYVPATVEDGKLVPGYFVPRDDAEPAGANNGGDANSDTGVDTDTDAGTDAGTDTDTETPPSTGG